MIILFLKKTFLFLLGGCSIVLVYFLLLNYVNYREFPEETDKNTIFIWGDSQAYQGIDLEELKKNTGKKILTAAKHGAGVYDFIVFAKGIPRHSNVIIAVPKLVLLRRKEKDRNDSGISLSSLSLLSRYGYTLDELSSIVRKNKAQKEILQESSKMYKYRDTIELKEPVGYFKGAYSHTPPYLEDKQNIFLKGIEILTKKDCSILFVEFPYHPILTEIEEKSELLRKTENFKRKLSNHLEESKIDTLTLSNKEHIMYDLTHLNEKGAQRVSVFIKKHLGRTDLFEQDNTKAELIIIQNKNQ